jgi:hypothetical protein
MKHTPAKEKTIAFGKGDLFSQSSSSLIRIVDKITSLITG